MTFLTYMMLGCLLMMVNLRGGKFEKISKEKYPEFEAKLLQEGIAPPLYPTFYKGTLLVVIIIYALFWPAALVKMVVKCFDKEGK